MDWNEICRSRTPRGTCGGSRGKRKGKSDSRARVQRRRFILELQMRFDGIKQSHTEQRERDGRADERRAGEAIECLQGEQGEAERGADERRQPF
jgi:hypothetical protein